MNENIDLTKILDKCPVGTKLYSTTHGTVTLQTVEKDKITVLDYRYCAIDYSKDGRYCPHLYGKGECTIFPSQNQKDWGKFERFWDKPKIEKFDPKTFQPFDKVLVRDNDCIDWKPDFFSHITNGDNEYCCACFRNYYKKAIPYNDETKHLVGTANDCPDYYKWWEE